MSKQIIKLKEKKDQNIKASEKGTEYQMKIIGFSMIIFAILTNIRAQPDDYDIKKLIDCMKQADSIKFCQGNDQICIAEKEKAQECTRNCLNNRSYFKSIANCIKSNCSFKSQNQNIQALIDKQAQCLNSNFISIALVLFVVALSTLN
ncbi:hypothetical protein ABPG74_019864 [Tetrahymena malaccensis]